MDTESAEGFSLRPLHLELDSIPILRALDLEGLDRFARGATLLDLD